MNEWLYLGLGIMIVTIIAEIITVGLTSIWLAGGALAALIVCALGGHWGLQILVFFAVTFVLLYFTRPFVIKYVNNRKTQTNYEETIGKEVRIVEKIDNKLGTGKALYNGIEWTARSVRDDVTFEPDEMGKVVAVEGVKLMLEKGEQE